MPSCIRKIDPDCPATRFVGFPSVKLAPNVKVKLLLAAKSGVTVDALVSVVIAPRCAAVQVLATDKDTPPAGLLQERTPLPLVVKN